MPYSILFSPAARLDLQDAYYYYEDIMPGLGDRFIENIDSRLEKLALTPLAGELRYEM